MTEPAALGSLTLGVRLKTTGSMNSPGETATAADVAACALAVSSASRPKAALLDNNITQVFCANGTDWGEVWRFWSTLSTAVCYLLSVPFR